MIWSFLVCVKLFALYYIIALKLHIIVPCLFENWTFQLRASIIPENLLRLDHMGPVSSLPNLHLSVIWFSVISRRLVQKVHIYRFGFIYLIFLLRAMVPERLLFLTRGFNWARWKSGRVYFGKISINLFGPQLFYTVCIGELAIYTFSNRCFKDFNHPDIFSREDINITSLYHILGRTPNFEFNFLIFFHFIKAIFHDGGRIITQKNVGFTYG